MNKEYLTYENKILGKEVKRLAKEVEKLEKDKQMLLNSMITEAHTKETKEIERLNNIINELDEYIVIKLKEFNTPEEYYTLKQIDEIHYRLQELKGSDK